MAKVPNSVERLPKISIAWVGCTNVTDRRPTDGRTTTYSEREREFTFAAKTFVHSATTPSNRRRSFYSSVWCAGDVSPPFERFCMQLAERKVASCQSRTFWCWFMTLLIIYSYIYTSPGRSYCTCTKPRPWSPHARRLKYIDACLSTYCCLNHGPRYDADILLSGLKCIPRLDLEKDAKAQLGGQFLKCVCTRKSKRRKTHVEYYLATKT